MTPANFEYKCRLCGENYIDGSTSKENAQIILICTVLGEKMPHYFIGSRPNMIGLHSGCKLGYGVSDLLGYTCKKE